MNNKSWVAYLPSDEYTLILILESVKGGLGDQGGELMERNSKFSIHYT